MMLRMELFYNIIVESNLGKERVGLKNDGISEYVEKLY